MTGREWFTRFDALCREAWTLGRLDITGTAWVSPEMTGQLKEGARERNQPYLIAPTTKNVFRLDQLNRGKIVMNMITGSYVEIQEDL
jgi:hypothetical protein